MLLLRHSIADLICRKHNIPLNLIANVDVSDDLLFQWISNRWVHLPSGRIYSTSYNPPKIPGLDDVTGEPLTKRPDDNPVRKIGLSYLCCVIDRPFSSRKRLLVASNTTTRKLRRSFIIMPRGRIPLVSWICTETRTRCGPH